MVPNLFLSNYCIGSLEFGIGAPQEPKQISQVSGSETQQQREDYVIRQKKMRANTQRLDTVIVHWGGAPQLLVIFS
jgi:hypothetical protein